MTLKETLLKQSIIELHWALQVVASVGPTYLPAQRNNNHTALFWDARRWIISPNIKPNRSFEVALDIAKLQLHFLGPTSGQPQGKPSSSFSLQGRTLKSAYEWLEGELEEYLNHNFEHVKRLPELPWDLPPNPINRGSIFSYQESVFQQCEQYLKMADAQLNYLRQQYHSNAGPILLWPQNFALSTLVREADREIEVGFRFVDKGVAKPHFFIQSTQVPAQKPALNHGEWQDQCIVLPIKAVEVEELHAQSPKMAAFLAENMHYLLSLPHQSNDFFK